MLFVISAPSGAGKTTIINELHKILPEIVFSVSATTRKKRENEIEGKDYFFISPDDFNKKITNNEFVETQKVFGNLYGTLKSQVEPFVVNDKIMVLDIDVIGALNIKKIYPESVIIYLDVDYQNLINRLKNRNTESDSEILKRLSRFNLENDLKNKFDYIIDNNNGIQESVNQIYKLILNKLNK